MEKDDKKIPYKQKKDTLKNVRRAWIYIQSRGYNELQTASIIGNLMQESYSYLDSKATNSIGAFGIAQWLGSRKEGLFKFAKENGKDATDFDTQIEYLLHELETTEKRAKNKLQDIYSLDEGAEIVARYYERPSEDEMNLEKRIKNAYDVYKMYAVNPLPERKIGLYDYNVSPDYDKPNKNAPPVPLYIEVKDKINKDNDILKKEFLKEKLKVLQQKKDDILDFVNSMNLEYVPRKRLNITNKKINL